MYTKQFKVMADKATPPKKKVAGPKKKVHATPVAPAAPTKPTVKPK